MGNIEMEKAIESGKNFLLNLNKKDYKNLNVEEVKNPKFNDKGVWIVTLSWEEKETNTIITALSTIDNPMKTVYKVFYVSKNGDVLEMTNRKKDDNCYY